MVILTGQKESKPEQHHKEDKLSQCSNSEGEQNSACAEHHHPPGLLEVAGHGLAPLQHGGDSAKAGVH